jgi:hypothetical protein
MLLGAGLGEHELRAAIVDNPAKLLAGREGAVPVA